MLRAPSLSHFTYVSRPFVSIQYTDYASVYPSHLRKFSGNARKGLTRLARLADICSSVHITFFDDKVRSSRDGRTAPPPSCDARPSRPAPQGGGDKGVTHRHLTCGRADGDAQWNSPRKNSATMLFLLPF